MTGCRVVQIMVSTRDHDQSVRFYADVFDLEFNARALEHGATEISPPADYAWKPRSSVIDDPSGNRIQLSQA